MTIFGPIIPNGHVEQAVLALAETWMATYLSEIERQASLGVPTLARPRSFQTSYDFQNWSEGQLPAIVCVCGDQPEDMQREGDGTYSGLFEVEVGTLVEDTTEANARRVAQLFQAALDAALVQHGSLSGFAQSTVLKRRRKTELPDVNNRTLAYAPSEFHISVEGVIQAQAGPPAPDAPLPDPTTPWPDWGNVTQQPEVAWDTERANESVDD